MRRVHHDEASSSSSPSMQSEDEEDVRADFLSEIDQQRFFQQLEVFQASSRVSPPAAVPETSRVSVPSTAPATNTGVTTATFVSPANFQSSPNQLSNSSCSNMPRSMDSSEFYSTAIQVLTHVLGSSKPHPWLSDQTLSHGEDPALSHTSTVSWDPKNSLASSPRDHAGHGIHASIDQFGASRSEPMRDKEQDLTQLLQTLLARGPNQTASSESHPQSEPVLAPPVPMPFADLAFPEDEDDDPDFMPVPSDRGRNELAMPSATAWTRAMEEMAPQESETSSTKSRRGRPRQFTSEEAAERKRDRNRDYMARLRTLRRQRRPYTPANSVDSQESSDRLVLEAENRFLRSEIERLQQENAKLRSREELRLYAAQFRMNQDHDGFKC